jgi:hypothetical protein
MIITTQTIPQSSIGFLLFEGIEVLSVLQEAQF